MNNTDDETDWFWGNRRGGSGAPLKTASGEVVTNLKLAVKKGNIDYGSPKNHDPYRNQQFDFNNTNGQSISSPNYPMSPNNLSSPTSNGPKKFMSALNQITGNQYDRDEKHRKEMEYKAMLQQQIEDNRNRKMKEFDMYEVPDTKKRDFLKSHNMSPNDRNSYPNNDNSYNNNNNNNGRNNDNRYNENNRRNMDPRNRDDDNRNTGGSNNNYNNNGNNNSYGQDRNNYPPPQDRYQPPSSNNNNNTYNNNASSSSSSSSSSPKKAYEIPGLTNNNNNYNQGNNRVYSDDRHDRNNDRDYRDYPPNNTRNDGNYHNGNTGNSNDRKFVSAGEYEVLTQLCNTLTAQQEELKAQLQKQNDYIQELLESSSKKQSSVRGKSVTSSSSTAANRAQSQPRPTRTTPSADTTSLRTQNMGRNIMNDTKFGRTMNSRDSGRKMTSAKDLEPPMDSISEKQSLLKKQYDKFASKPLEKALKNSTGNKNSAGGGSTGMARGGSSNNIRRTGQSAGDNNYTPSKTNRTDNIMNTPTGSKNGMNKTMGNTGNGFQKLLSNNAKQPTIVTYDNDNNNNKYGGNPRQHRDSELQGNSTYVPYK